MIRSRNTLGLLVALLIALPLQASAQTPSSPETAEQQRAVTRVFRLQHISPQEAYGLLGSIAPLRRSDSLGIITITAPPNQVAAFEEALRQIDQPQSAPGPEANVILTVHFVGVDESGDQPVPPELQPVIEELRKHFPYERYTLLETFGVRATAGDSASVEGVMPGSSGPWPTTYGFNALLGPIANRERVDLHEVAANWRVPFQSPTGDYNFSEIQIQTKLAIPVSKTVVVGKAGVARTGSGVGGGLFVVMRADIVP